MKCLIANDKGGVGKSTIAQFVVSKFKEENLDFRALDFDEQPKLGRMFGPSIVTSSPVGPSMAAIMDNPMKAEAFWDPLVRFLRVDRPLLVDFGAHAFDRFAEWGRISSLKEMHKGPIVTLVVPVTADLDALNGARRAIKGFSDLFTNYRLVIALSDKDGPMESMTGVPEFDTLFAQGNSPDILRVRVPVLRAGGYPALNARGMSIADVGASNFRDIAAKAGMSPPLAARTISGCQAWMSEMSDQFSKVFDFSANPSKQAAASSVEQSPEPVEQRPVQIQNVGFHSVPAQLPEPAQSAPQQVAGAVGMASISAIKSKSNAEPSDERASTAGVVPQVAVTSRYPRKPHQASQVPPERLSQEEFDEFYYVSKYPDIARAVRVGEIESGYVHYELHGLREGRQARRVVAYSPQFRK